ncbi:hypothetical protein [Fictibacillus sp. BK138]|uniref:hypothetical protein n=1 Tax=Fictibacillus sp. BK138 TaxID=2512121 RepID=UPI0010DCC106|nr:hypothetical protein [Fictibacillus sp. BK138]RZT21398.1 hypothetical protein EV282_0460 [Fictibacillus sp. BK138]
MYRKLPIIGALFLFIITIVNLLSENDYVTDYVSLTLFIIILVLYFAFKKGTSSK